MRRSYGVVYAIGLMAVPEGPPYRAVVAYFETALIAPVEPPVSAPGERLTAAFAGVRDAYYAVGILDSGAAAPVLATVEPLYDERGNEQLILLRIELDGLDRERVLTAVAGGHGVVIRNVNPGRARRTSASPASPDGRSGRPCPRDGCVDAQPTR